MLDIQQTNIAIGRNNDKNDQIQWWYVTMDWRSGQTQEQDPKRKRDEQKRWFLGALTSTVSAKPILWAFSKLPGFSDRGVWSATSVDRLENSAELQCELEAQAVVGGEEKTCEFAGIGHVQLVYSFIKGYSFQILTSVMTNTRCVFWRVFFGKLSSGMNSLGKQAWWSRYVECLCDFAEFRSSQWESASRQSFAMLRSR